MNRKFERAMRKLTRYGTLARGTSTSASSNLDYPFELPT
jgi:hypothetical protein